MSSKVVSGPKLRRITPPETFLGSFSAATTWLGLPRWQAEPAEMQMPWLPRSVTMFWLGQPSRDTDRMWGAAGPPPRIFRSGMAPRTSAAWARRAAMWSRISVRRSVRSSTALAKPAIWAVASVPERRPPSWPPPGSRGRGFFTRGPMYSAPMPLGPPILWPEMEMKSAPRVFAAKDTFKKPWTASVCSRVLGFLAASPRAISSMG